jgi:hypothetical protein
MFWVNKDRNKIKTKDKIRQIREKAIEHNTPAPAYLLMLYRLLPTALLSGLTVGAGVD